jgi:hypothetical protein
MPVRRVEIFAPEEQARILMSRDPSRIGRCGTILSFIGSIQH